MKRLDESEVLAGLLCRLEELRPETERLWGTLSAAEMLCHLADANEGVLTSRGGGRHRFGRGFVKWVALYSGLPWPKGAKTLAAADPRRGGSRPQAFEADLRRVTDSLRTLAQAGARDLPPVHAIFGRMTVGDWHRWAYCHTEHHLRQFGL